MDSIELLQKLTEAHGVSGYEGPIKKIVEEYFKSIGKIHKDQIGSLIVEKNGSEKSPR
ncbi:MAG: peptidase M28, partial [Chloroflexi bacterium HGW-Chloroflexi-8]